MLLQKIDPSQSFEMVSMHFHQTGRMRISKQRADSCDNFVVIVKGIFEPNHKESTRFCTLNKEFNVVSHYLNLRCWSFYIVNFDKLL